MMLQHQADYLRNELEPVLPAEAEVTSAPWHNEGPKDEWIVTLWSAKGDVLADVFGVGKGYVVRKPARGSILGETNDVADLAGILRNILDR